MAIVKDAEYYRRYRAARGARTGTHGPAPTAQCGTRSGYIGHKRRGEPVDDACRDAYNEAARAYYHATKKLKRRPESFV